MKFNNIDKNNSGSISMENLHSIKSVNDFYNFYEMYGDAHSSVWFVGLEPQGHPKPDELKKNTNWPKEEAFSLGKRKKFSAYEKSCISINKLCYQLNGLDEEDLFRCNMYPLNLPQHNGKHFNNFLQRCIEYKL